MASMIQQEITKYMTEKMHGGNGNSDSSISFAHFAEYAVNHYLINVIMFS